MNLNKAYSENVKAIRLKSFQASKAPRQYIRYFDIESGKAYV